jgi:large subunit ribosomal protein L30
MATVKITQVRSTAGSNPTQRATLESLKLGRIGKETTMADTPQLRGMIRTVSHLVEVSD